jgi:hypothetical protein
VPGLVERLEVGADAAYAVVRDGDRPALWRTPVDEDAWRRLPLPALDSAVVDVGGLAAVGDTVALTVRSDVETFALVSTDAGATFAARPTPCAADLDAGEVSAVRGALWLACPTGTALTVHVSTDAGVSWSALPTTRPALSDTAAELGARSRGEAVVAVPGEAVAVGRAGTSTTKVPGLGDPAFAGFTTERVGYILDLSGGLFRTTDGGTSWRLVEVR